MTRPRGRARNAALVASIAAHIILLLAVAQHVSRLGPAWEPPGVEPSVIPVFLSPPARSAPTAAQRRLSIPFHRRRSDTASAEASAPPGVPTTVQGTISGLPPGVAAALHARAGCAERSGLTLTREERGDCEGRLGRGAAISRYIPTPIDPDIRAYYDAVAKAKAPDGPLTPQSARGRAGLFQDVAVGAKGHPPAVICHISFGAGRARLDRPPHGLRLGPLPCFLAPPRGSLTPDVDIVNPDSIIRHPPPGSAPVSNGPKESGPGSLPGRWFSPPER